MGKQPAKTFDEITPDFVRNKLKLKALVAKQDFSKKYSHAEKFLAQKGIDLSKIREHSAKILGAGALAGTIAIVPPNLSALPAPSEIVEKLQAAGKSVSAGRTAQEELVATVSAVIPEKPRPLTREEEKNLEQIFRNTIGIPAKAALEGEHLNTTYGLIGAEQHLRRFPGDSLAKHGEGVVLKEGMAPGLGGWGYFARSESQLTPDLAETEKWYAVVQTLYLPDWSRRLKYLIQWYKYRKVLIVNTNNGNAVVAAIADAGPAAWTGKVFGGSPEVMYHLGGARYKKGPVVLFFVDDPQNKIPLGPVEYNKISQFIGQST